MLNFISKFLDSNEKEIKKSRLIVEQINSLEKKVEKLSDEEFPKETEKLKKRYEKGESLVLLLPEAFALVREAAKRTIGQRHFDVQIISAITLASGKISEQKTGEGKTLSAVPALYLHALTGESVHLVTVNDYLARRDAGWMGTVFAFLGMSVSSIINQKSFIYDPQYHDAEAKDYRMFHLKETNRKEAYTADIVYGINSEFGFDYLRDNMAFTKEEQVQRGHYYAVIDEVDSVLIDEARTPHIISMPDATPSNKYYDYAKLVDKLSPIDYKIDEKRRTAHLTDHGIGKIETMFGMKDIYEKDFETVYHIEAALKGRTLFHKNKDYIVREGQVILIDEFTGRLLEGRRLSEGLHQALEAKEGVAVQRESKTLATISLQNYFRKYELLAGMTGTAITESEEFNRIYKLDVLAIPPNREIIRRDESDKIYKTRGAKIFAVVHEIEEAHKKGQPILVGTASIEQNEIISEYLKRKNIQHEVLNAKNHLREALIIKDAGKKGAVTVATNVAGRGVDIILGGESPSEFSVEYQGKEGKKKFEKEMAAWQKEHDEVKKLGGLLVIGTEKHESRRIDNQLRGRSGRQGDPGRSVFIISLEDDLMRIFGGEQIANLMTRFNFPEDQPLENPIVTRVITQAQVKVEGFNFESRKHTVEYDDVLNKQREIIYGERQDIIEEDFEYKEFVKDKIKANVDAIVALNLNFNEIEDPHQKIIQEFSSIIPFDQKSQDQLIKQIQQKEGEAQISEFLNNIADQLFEKKAKDFGEETIKKVTRLLSLQVINNMWMDHLTAMEDVRTGINLRGYAQKDPLIEYKNEAFGQFERLVKSIDDGIVNRFFKVNIVTEPHVHNHNHNHEHEHVNQPAEEIGRENQKTIRQLADKNQNYNLKEKSLKSGDMDRQVSSINTIKKLGRNDPCWCGSGKKWKKCHMNSDLGR